MGTQLATLRCCCCLGQESSQDETRPIAATAAAAAAAAVAAAAAAAPEASAAASSASISYTKAGLRCVPITREDRAAIERSVRRLAVFRRQGKARQGIQVAHLYLHRLEHFHGRKFASHLPLLLPLLPLLLWHRLLSGHAALSCSAPSLRGVLLFALRAAAGRCHRFRVRCLCFLRTVGAAVIIIRYPEFGSVRVRQGQSSERRLLSACIQSHQQSDLGSENPTQQKSTAQRSARKKEREGGGLGAGLLHRWLVWVVGA
jgi:hypothetical protein